MSVLLAKQVFFTQQVVLLLQEAFRLGYQVTLGEVWRSAETAALDAAKGKGIVHSLHGLRLALDLNLFKDGTYLSATSDYAALGQYWESLGTPGYPTAWGGRFGDGNHFSVSHNGVR